MASFRSEETDTPSDQGWRSLTSFWGKARPPAERPSPSYHPLIFHSLDVAAVGRALLSRWPDLAAGLAAALGLEVEAATALLVRLLALHDLGKFARRFQAKSPPGLPNAPRQRFSAPFFPAAKFPLLFGCYGIKNSLFA
jgi:CRISPR-associated endonuclease/helicase Cas3